MKVCIYSKESYTNKENEITNKYYFATSFKDKKTGEMNVAHYVVFSNDEYNIGDLVDVSRNKTTGKYFIPNKK